MQQKRRLYGPNLVKTIGIHLFLIVIVVISLYPIFIMVVDSLKTAQELNVNVAGWPFEPSLNNYQRLLDYNSGVIMRTFFNSIGVSTVYTAITLVIATLAAFAFAKYKFKGKEVIFVLFLATMMVPQEVNITPLYLIFSKLGWLNTYQVQIIPGIANVFAMYMFRNYMESVPDSILEAARIDGASHIGVYAKIMLPAISPAIGAMAILTFLGKWNDYLFPKIMIDKVEFMPIMVMVPNLKEGTVSYFTPWELIMAGCVLVTLPLIVVFFIFQDKFMDSVTVGAVKG